MMSQGFDGADCHFRAHRESEVCAGPHFAGCYSNESWQAHAAVFGGRAERAPAVVRRRQRRRWENMALPQRCPDTGRRRLTPDEETNRTATLAHCQGTSRAGDTSDLAAIRYGRPRATFYRCRRYAGARAFTRNACSPVVAVAAGYPGSTPGKSGERISIAKRQEVICRSACCAGRSRPATAHGSDRRSGLPEPDSPRRRPIASRSGSMSPRTHG